MAVIKFGHTWWGAQWLRALDNIDYSNRLPRGERYARNGSVVEININGRKVHARISGTRPQPYKVKFELWSFSAQEKKSILSLIRESPYYLSQLEARILPPELHEELEKRKIRLFPRSWKELKMHCSCPDWAVPCKHLAAVVYLIANEIDKNPFLVFQLHDMDLMEALHPEGLEEESILDISRLTTVEEEYNYFRENLEQIDFTRIPDMEESINGLLTDFPLFYLKKDFKNLLTMSTRKMSRSIKKHIKTLEISEEPPQTRFTTGEFRLLKTKHRYTGFLKKGNKKLEFSSLDPEPLILYLRDLSAGDLSAYPPLLSYLIMVHGYVLMLIRQKALVPEIYTLGKGVYQIRWIPALFNPAVKEIFENLLSALPRTLVKWGTSALEPREQLLFLGSFFTQYYFDLFSPLKDAEKDSIPALFFCGADYRPERFEERENARTIHLWLGRFFLRPIHHYPLIRVEEIRRKKSSEDSFLFELLIRDRRDDTSPPIALEEFLEQKDPEELALLRDLNLLSTYLPTVNTYLKEMEPVTIAADEFVEIWFKALSALKTLGIATIVPKSIKDLFVPQLTLAFEKKSVSTDKIISYTGLKEMLDFEWSLAVGEDFIGKQEFEALTKNYRGIIRYKDKYLVLNEKDLEKIKKQWEKKFNPSSLDLMKIQLEEKYNGIPIKTDNTLKSVLKDLFTPGKTSPPEGLLATLRPYQEIGYGWLYHNYRIGLGSLIADDMGLGKTLQVIAFLLKLKEEGSLTPKKAALVIVPASLATNWSREIEKFAPSLQNCIFHGLQRRIDPEAEIIITTYAVAAQDRELLQKKKWRAVVIDEAQNIKTPETARTKAVKSIKADIRIAMTGTPVENKLMDYWSVLDFIMKNLLGNKTGFKEKFAIPIERYRDQEALNTFRNLTAPFILRRMKTDKTIISDLPEKIRQNEYTGLGSKQAALYEELTSYIEDQLETLEGIERSGVIFKLITGLKQICDHPYLFLKEGARSTELSGKMQEVETLMEKILSNGEKALIFTQFAEMGHLLKEILSEKFDTEIPFLYGAVTRAKRDQMIDLFQNDLECKIMILSLKAGGVGLNLTAANHVIHYDLWWNPAVENQATDRAFRIGQKKDVTVHRFITKGTFEEKINAMLEQKQELADLTVARGEKWINDLSTNDLKELLKLERE